MAKDIHVSKHESTIHSDTTFRFVILIDFCDNTQ